MPSLTPVNYKIYLEPDLDTFRFFGQVEITLKAKEKVGQVCLNVLDLTIDRCLLKQGSESISCSFALHPQQQELRISLPQSMGVPY